MAKLYFTVTNDLNFDQRMIRICTTLHNAGYKVCLIGRKKKNSISLQNQVFDQRRLYCFFEKGKLFYLEFNIRLFFFLLFHSFDGVCAVDLDTILPAFYASKFKHNVIIYDAHEFFTEVPEVVERPKIQKVWKKIEAFTVPKIKYCYTVCDSLAHLFNEKYNTTFEVVRNVPFHILNPAAKSSDSTTNFILLYQGALNEGRGLELAIKTVSMLDGVELWLAGEGDLSYELRQLSDEYNAKNKIKFLGFIRPKDLKLVTNQIDVGLNLLENKGLNYYYSLANKFFDYMQARKPSINMAFPEYIHLLNQFQTGLVIDDLNEKQLSDAILILKNDVDLYTKIKKQCDLASSVFTWEKESEKLIDFYHKIFKT